jgi:LemA protein
MENTNKNFFQRYMGWVIALVVVVLLVVWVISAKNGFVRQNEAITGQWSQVEVQFQRRFDLIPNIVATVQGVAKQEQAVFGAIAEARTHYAGATTQDARAKAATEVESALGRLLVITENYPTLQSSQAYRDLIVTLEGTENRISVERKKYNDLVQIFDTNIKTFPSSVIASLFGVNAREYFNAPAEAETVPKVNF